MSRPPLRMVGAERYAGPGGKLELREEPSGLRHYLNGQPVHAGTMLDLQVEAHVLVWIRVDYEWTFRRGDRPQLRTSAGTLHALPDAILRWPAGTVYR